MKAGWSIIAGLAVAAMASRGFGSADVPGSHLWPLEGYTRIAAGFCDYRTRHFHGGIDISTNGQEGLKVRAADSGWVTRVSTSWWGYGKAVYIQLAGGGIAVYGHLSEFAPKIAAYVEDEQYASERYQQSLFPAPGQIPIARGEIIGKTGQTGVGPPHLHFELRTDGNRPVNPLTSAFQKDDKVAPSLVSVTLVPRQPDALDVDPSAVNGSMFPVTIDLQGDPEHRHPGVIPVITGTIGIAILAEDRIDSGAGTVTPYRTRLLANEKLVCEVRWDSIDYHQTRMIDLEEQYVPKPGIEPRAINLFRWPKNTSWHYDSLKNDGWLALGTTLNEGDNTIRIEAEDIAGNASVAEFSVRAVAGINRSTDTLGRPEWDDVNFAYAWNGLVIRIISRSSKQSPGFVYARGRRRLRGWPCDTGSWNCWLPALASVDTIWTSPASGEKAARPHALSPGRLPGRPSANSSWVLSTEGCTLESSDGAATVVVGPDGLYESTFLLLYIASPRGYTPGALSPLYEFGPVYIPLARDARLAIATASVAATSEKLAIYRYLGKTGGWDFAGNKLDTAAGTISATIPRTGSYALLADTTPPTIRKVTPGKGEAIKGRRPLIRFELADDLSGFGSEGDVRLTIDGQWVPVEYDPDLGTAKAEPRRDLAKGEHKVVVVARDRMGNENTFTRALRITQ